MTNHLDVTNTAFHSQQGAVDWLEKIGVLVKTRQCVGRPGRPCNKEVTLMERKGGHWRWDCTRKGCTKNERVRAETLLESSSIPLHRLLWVLADWMLESQPYTTVARTNLDHRTIQSLRDTFRNVAQMLFRREWRPIGGRGRHVQVDETIFVSGQQVRCPSCIEDNEIEDSTWVVGGVCTETGDFFLEVVPNRRVPTLVELLGRNVLPETTLVTDGFASYPGAADELRLNHIQVIHRDGYVNHDGFHTQLIKCLWNQ